MIRFVKWWWRKQDGYTRTIALVVPSLGVSIPLGIVVSGSSAFWVLVCIAPMLLAISFWLCYTLYRQVSGEFKAYMEEDPPEDVKIVNRLKGK